MEVFCQVLKSFNISKKSVRPRHWLKEAKTHNVDDDEETLTISLNLCNLLQRCQDDSKGFRCGGSVG